MKRRFRLRHDAHVRADSTCNELSAYFGTAGGQDARAKLSTSVTDGGRLLADRERHEGEWQSAVRQIAQWSRALRAGLTAVVKFCSFAKIDELAKVVTLPALGSAREVLATGQAILDKLTPYRQALLDAGLPAEVFDNLRGQIDGLTAARDAKDAARRNFSAAGKDLAAVLNAGDGGLEVLHNILKATPQAHPGAVTKLAMAKRLGPRATEKVEAPAASAPASTADTPPKAVA